MSQTVKTKSNKPNLTEEQIKSRKFINSIGSILTTLLILACLYLGGIPSVVALTFLWLMMSFIVLVMTFVPTLFAETVQEVRIETFSIRRIVRWIFDIILFSGILYFEHTITAYSYLVVTLVIYGTTYILGKKE